MAALKQDAKSFRYRQMGMGCQKRLTLAPLYAIAKTLLPSLDISQLNIAYCASLANFYSIYDLRRLKEGQTNLYLLCYAWQRYRQLTDNIVEAFGHHIRQLEDDTKQVAVKQAAQIHNERQQVTPRLGELILLYVDDTLTDETPFGKVRHRVFGIMPEEKLRKRLDVGDIYLDDSGQHQRFAEDVVSMEAKADTLKALDIPWLR